MKRSTSTLRRLLALVLVLVMVGSLFAGCNKKEKEEPVSTEPSESIQQTDAPTEATEEPTAEPTEEPTEPAVTVPPVVMGTVNADNLNVRSEPYSTADILKRLAINSRIEILEQKIVDGVNWGRIAEGWINLNYVTIDGEGTVITESGYAVLANKGSDLTVNGGTFNLGETKNKGHLYAQNSSVLTINGGTYISGDADTPIVYCINAFIEINGGFFQNTANPNAALISMSNNLKYANNQKITLSGGTFVNWNPMSSAFARPYENPTVPALIVLADGYQVVSEVQENGDTWYMVVPMN